MAEPAVQVPATLAEFLAWERGAPETHEFVDGEITLMTSPSNRHSWVVSNIVRAFFRELTEDSPCMVFSENVTVRTATANVHPDIVVTCSPYNDDDDVISEPVVVVEVVSPSSEARDLVTKFNLYLGTASVRHYLIVRPDRREIVHFRRTPAGTFEAAAVSAGLTLDPPGFRLPLAAIWRGARL